MSGLLGHQNPLIQTVLNHLETRYGINPGEVNHLTVRCSGAGPLFIDVRLIITEPIGLGSPTHSAAPHTPDRDPNCPIDSPGFTPDDPADPCARGCTDPAAHAEGAHDV